MTSKPRRGATIVVIVVAALAAGAQLVPVDRTNPEVRSDLRAPADVKAILAAACYDCHSHETSWPWYARVAPVSWWLAGHVEDGRADLNFSEWPALDFEMQDLLLHDIETQLMEERMPPTSYALFHPEARLSDVQRARLLEWIRQTVGGDDELGL